MSLKRKKPDFTGSPTALVPNPEQACRKQPWMEEKPLFSLFGSKHLRTEAAVERDGPDSRTSGSSGRAQELFHSRQEVQKHRRSRTSQANVWQKNKNLHQSLIKVMSQRVAEDCSSSHTGPFTFTEETRREMSLGREGRAELESN
ncbi:hypothetical protein AMECASPLE_038094 [Ameca splendens]|uniref:Uncharacterized protein n=1 Tax=Ameca splendens TaxID=208324 RepID=A0ABV0XL63_9TELE